jgi:type IV pilus assembly protein PilC
MSWPKILINTSISKNDLLIFFRQFYLLIKSGIPILQTCDILSASQRKPILRKICLSLRKNIASGKPLSNYLNVATNFFDPIIGQLIKVAEQTGTLELMLANIIHYYEREVSLRKKFNKILFYPFIILSIACICLIFMLIIIVPRFKILFQDHLQQLPVLTKIIFTLSDILINFWFIFTALTLLILYVIFSKRYAQTRSKSYSWAYRLPILKSLYDKMYLIQFFKNLKITQKAGIPLVDGLKLSIVGPSDNTLTKTIMCISLRLAAGIPFYQALTYFKYFPPFSLHMLKIGEISGQLAESLEYTYLYLETDLDTLLERITILLEPLIILILGVLIGSVMLGLYLPIFNLGTLL